jgi:HPt (histidine-containing phosphotransfer) domain-containing protein
VRIFPIRLVPVDVPEAARKKDLLEVKVLAHKLRGASGSYGLTRVMHAAAEVENFSLSNPDENILIKLITDLETEVSASIAAEL